VPPHEVHHQLTGAHVDELRSDTHLGCGAEQRGVVDLTSRAASRWNAAGKYLRGSLSATERNFGCG